MHSKLDKWRLILGKDPEEEEANQSLEGDSAGMEAVLSALYDQDRRGGLGKSSPNLNRWLGDIRKYFPQSVVQVMQKDALDRLGLKKLLMEPEILEIVTPDIHLVSTLLTLQKAMPDQTRQTAKMVVRKLVEELQKKLAAPLIEAINGSLSRNIRNRRPRFTEIDWHKTIRINLKNYQPDYKTIIPEYLRGYGRRGEALKKVILLVDQSGSMVSSVVYAAILGAVMASIRSIKTHLIVFDTEVVDLTENLSDPIELLFATQLGGGTDIAKALYYTDSLIQNPSDTIIILISDLYEGGNVRSLLQQAANIKQKGSTFITLLALSDQGVPAYDHDIAARFAVMEIPVFACTPDEFPNLMAQTIRG